MEHQSGSLQNHNNIHSLPRSPSAASRARSVSVGGYETTSVQRKTADHPLAWTEKNWSGPSPAMITIPNPVRTTPDGKIAQSRSVRRARVEAIRRRRTAQHVSNFLHINIAVTPSLTFPVTIEADRNIEHLARYVEAEYAFRYQRKTTGTLSTENDEDTEYQPLECGLLYDVGMVPLRYTDRIGDVLNMNDVVNVLNAFEENSPRQELDSNVIYSVDDLSSLSTPTGAEDIDISDKTELIQTENTRHRTVDELQRRAPRGKTYKLISNPTSDDRCISILHNKLGLEYFQQFCTRTYSVENLLFWLDTEMFQYAKSSSSALLQARYIYITYIAADSPLQVNLTEEIRKDVPWPLPDGWVVDLNMFDEAQEHVFFILRKQMFPMFENSEFYQQFLNVKKEDRQKYEAARITGPFTDFFAPNLDVMRSSAELANSSSVRQWDLEMNSRSNLWIKEQLLDRTMNQFFSSHGPVVDYFSDSHRLTTAQKCRKVQKEKKLAKFFGEKPSSDLIARQVDTTRKEPPSPAFVEDRSIPGVAAKTGEPESDFYSKKKKVDKLEGFFGDRLGESQLVDQKLMMAGDLMLTKSINEFPAFSTLLRRSSSSPQPLSDSYPNLVTSNDLSLEERRLLSKRSKKLRGILGEPLKEDIVALSLTNPTKGPSLNSSPVLNATVDMQTGGEGSTGHTETDQREKEDSEGSERSATRRIRERSHSVDSVQTIDSVLLDRNSREYRRKKLEKLYQFLGEKIPASTLSGRPVSPIAGVALVEPAGQVSSKPLSSREKQANIKRFNKLERLLGEQPPSDLITNTDTLTLQTRSLANLDKVLTGPDLVLELVDYISEFDRTMTIGRPNRCTENTDQSHMHVQSPASNSTGSSGNGGPVPQPNISPNLGASDSDINSNAAKLARQRKLIKLKRFFGDQLDPVHLVEQSILEDLEKSIDDEMTSGKDVSQLKRDLSKLRDEIRRRSSALQFFESDDRPNLTSPTSPSPLLNRCPSKSSPTSISSKFSALSYSNPLRTSVTLNSGLASFTKKSKSSNSPRDPSHRASLDDETRTFPPLPAASPSSTTISSESLPAIPPSPNTTQIAN